MTPKQQAALTDMTELIRQLYEQVDTIHKAIAALEVKRAKLHTKAAQEGLRTTSATDSAFTTRRKSNALPVTKRNPEDDEAHEGLDQAW